MAEWPTVIVWRQRAVTTMKRQLTLLLVALVAAASARVAWMTKCSDVDQEQCKVTELRIDPCTTDPCRLKLGKNVSIEFDFTPNFAATQLKTAVYFMDIPMFVFSSIGAADACQYVTCPTVPGIPNKFTYPLRVRRIYPRGKYQISWKVWNAEDEKQVCCFETQVKLLRK